MLRYQFLTLLLALYFSFIHVNKRKVHVLDMNPLQSGKLADHVKENFEKRLKLGPEKNSARESYFQLCAWERLVVLTPFNRTSIYKPVIPINPHRSFPPMQIIVFAIPSMYLLREFAKFPIVIFIHAPKGSNFVYCYSHRAKDEIFFEFRGSSGAIFDSVNNTVACWKCPIAIRDSIMHLCFRATMSHFTLARFYVSTWKERKLLPPHTHFLSFSSSSRTRSSTGRQSLTRVTSGVVQKPISCEEKRESRKYF